MNNMMKKFKPTAQTNAHSHSLNDTGVSTMFYDVYEFVCAAEITWPFVRGGLQFLVFISVNISVVVLFGSHINFSGGQHGYSGDFKYAMNKHAKMS